MLKHKIKLLTIICATSQITNTYCMFNLDNSISELCNNILNSDSTDNYYIDDIISFSSDTQSINQSNVTENNNQQNTAVEYSNNNNENEKKLLGRKSKRFIGKKNRENIPNVKLNYKEFVNINNIIKQAIPGNIEKIKAEYHDTLYYMPTNTKYAEYYLKQIECLTKMENNKFPILDNLNITSVNYTGFKVQNTVQKVKDLQDIIKNIINYKYKNCELTSKKHKKLKEILEKMQNDKMTKRMFNTLKNIGVIVRNPNRIRFFKDKEQQDNLFKLNNIREDFENMCNSDDNNVLKENTKKLYDTIMNNTYMDLLFNKHSGFTKIISKRFMPIMTKILTKMNSSGLNKDFIKFKLNRANTTFDLMEQRLINGEEAIFEYDKTPKENEQEFYTYYTNMLEKTNLFLPSISKEKKYIFSVINTLKNYDCRIRADKNISVPSELSKLNTIKVLIDFLENNGNKSLDEWYNKLKLKSNEIFKKSWETYVENTDLKEWLEISKKNINDEKDNNKSKTIYTFIEQINCYKDRLYNENNHTIEILNNILVSDTVKNFITNDLAKYIFTLGYNEYIQNYNRSSNPVDYYNSIMVASFIDILYIIKLFSYLSENPNYSVRIKDMFSKYSYSIVQATNSEIKQYINPPHGSIQ